MIITEHARMRLKDRCGIDRINFIPMAKTALENGITRKECYGQLREYLDVLSSRHRKGNCIRLFGEYIFVFRGSLLITVFTIPNYLKDIVNSLFDQKDER